MITETQEIKTQEENIEKLNLKPGIFKELEENKICFSVLTYKNKLRFEPNVDKNNVKRLKYDEGTDKVSMKNVKSKTYELLILLEDSKQIKKSTFNKLSFSKHNDVVSHEMNENEIYYFKKNNEKFITHINENEGGVFELKGNSFIEYREKQLDKMKPLARKMINKFYQPLKELKPKLSNKEMKEYAKARSINITNHFMKEMTIGSKKWIHNQKLISAINNLE